jgi:SAM-dependent methyltransferase
MPRDRSIGVVVRHAAGWGFRRLSGVLLDRRQGVDTWKPVSLASVGLAHEERVEYTPSGWLDVRRALRGERITGDDVFVDLGSGKGRAVLEAARLPFKRVIGVEIAPELTEVARANVATLDGQMRCGGVDLVTADVTAYRLPDDVTLVYIYNAFSGAVFQQVVDELIASVDRCPRRLRLLYRAPREHDVLVRSGRFRVVREVRAIRPTRAWARAGGIRVYAIEPLAGTKRPPPAAGAS